jgi:hypothetical protein
MDMASMIDGTISAAAATLRSKIMVRDHYTSGSSSGGAPRTEGLAALLCQRPDQRLIRLIV